MLPLKKFSKKNRELINLVRVIGVNKIMVLVSMAMALLMVSGISSATSWSGAVEPQPKPINPFKENLTSFPEHDFVGHGTYQEWKSITQKNQRANQNSNIVSTIPTIPSTKMVSLNSGDLNGDSVDDALIVNRSYDSYYDEFAYTVDAVKGMDGSILWSKTNSGLYKYGFYCGGDLNGDGAKDVLIYTETYSSYYKEYTHTVSAVNGNNGAVLWTFTKKSDKGLYSTWMDVEFAGDVNGDGADDVLINSKIYSSYYIYTYTIYALNGKSGSNFWSKSSDSWLYAHTSTDSNGKGSSDFNGDGKNDVLYNSRKYSGLDYTDTITAVRGSDGYVFWSKTGGTNEYVDGYPAGGDFNGDGVDDVVKFTITGYYTYTYTFYAVNGKDGSNLWSKSWSTPSLVVGNIGDLNGDGSDDVLIHTKSYSSATYYTTVYATNGKDGSNLWTMANSAGILAIGAGDLSGDGAKDALVFTKKYSSDEYYTKVYAVNGKNGYEFWSKSISTGITARRAGDLNGDGGEDVLVLTLKYGSYLDLKTYPITISAVNGKDGSELWNKSNSDGIDAHRAGDLDGNGIEDVVVYTLKYDYSSDTRTSVAISAVKGSDGSEFWSFPPSPQLSVSVSESPDPVESGGTSQVTIRVTSDGSAVSVASVSVSATGGSIYPTSGTTDSNGEFKTTFTAPNVTSNTTYTISATATKSGYKSGSGSDTITVILPPCSLSVSVSESPDPVESGGTSQVTIRVTSDGSAVSDASVSVSATGGSIYPTSGTTDSNGEFKTTFTAPNVTSNTTYTISATATKSGCPSVSGVDTITVYILQLDCIPWDDQESENGTTITLKEIQEAIYMWANDIPPRNGCSPLTLNDIQKIIDLWSKG